MPSLKVSPDGVLNASFMNGAGQEIILKKLNISYDDTKCEVTFPDKSDNNADNLSLPISMGEVFRVEAQCPTENFNSETLRFRGEIEYTLTIAGAVVTHNERGTMSAVYGVDAEKKKFREMVYDILLLLIAVIVSFLVIRKYRKRKEFNIKKEIKETFRLTFKKIVFVFVLIFLWQIRVLSLNLFNISILGLPGDLFYNWYSENLLFLGDDLGLLIFFVLTFAYFYVALSVVLRAIQVLRE